MRWRIYLALEGPSDLRRIKVIVDHLLRELHGPQAAIEDLRSYERFEGSEFIPIKRIPEFARQRHLPRYHTSGSSNQGDGGTLRKLHFVLKKDRLLGPGVVIVWQRDTDEVPQRRAHASAARNDVPQEEATVVLAIATECGEAWPIAGWAPENKADHDKLKLWKQKLGFEPNTYPERLSHKENVPKSAKEVHHNLFGDDEDREQCALLAATTGSAAASQACGLRAFCDDVRERLC